MANYDFTEFEDLNLGPTVGKVFVVFSVLINAVVLLNFIIAILADTYSNLARSKLGLYYDGVISRINIYEDDEYYGGLIVGTPPFNVLAIFMIPVYMCVKDKKKLKRINDVFTKLIFFPTALAITAFFIAFNLVLIPFAYLTTVFKKAKMMCVDMSGQRKTGERVKNMKSKSPGGDFLLFLLLGLPMLIVT